MRRLLFRLLVWWVANRAAFRASVDAQLRGASFGTSIAMAEHAARQARKRAQEGRPRRQLRPLHLVAGDQVGELEQLQAPAPSSIEPPSSED